MKFSCNLGQEMEFSSITINGTFHRHGSLHYLKLLFQSSCNFVPKVAVQDLTGCELRKADAVIPLIGGRHHFFKKIKGSRVTSSSAARGDHAQLPEEDASLGCGKKIVRAKP